MERPALLDMDQAALAAFVKAMGQPAFRARQLHGWLLRGARFDEMTNLPEALRSALAQSAREGGVRIVKTLTSQKDGTRKYLFALHDGECIEGVYMPHDYGNTLCISTQVGCRMGCAFCASTLEGRVRNLTRGEMLGQVIAARRDNGGGRAVDHIVLMGSGEPLDNYAEVVAFLRRLNEPDGLGISLRNVSLSTCGLPEAMRALADEKLPVTLSVSLHAPDDALRATIMPIAKRYSIQSVMDALRYYVAQTGRRGIVEYALISGLNDSVAHARALARLLRNLQVHVNVIALNAVPERGLPAPTEAQVQAFLQALSEAHISATKRRSMGNDIQGACGQLRRSHQSREGEIR
nr:23S rRNA (adenine(2503)-C(2))-methyltransferase RlmN [Maliibacterium massiliense]